MRKFRETLLVKVNKTEIDLDFPFYTDGNEGKNDVEIPYEEITFGESPSMDIDEVMQILSDMKDKGSNRVYIADHSDHHGYHFYGVKLTEITE